MKIHWRETAGYLLIVLASCFFGAAASVGKAIMHSGISAVMLMQVRSLFTAGILLPLLLIIAPRHLRIAKSDVPAFLLLAIPGLALVNVSYYYAVNLLTVAMAVFIQFTAPVFIFLYGWLRKKEIATPQKMIALLLSLAGTYFMVQLNQQHGVKFSWIGIASAFISTFSYAFYVIMSHRLRQKHSPWTLMIYGYGIAAIFWCCVQNVMETANLLTAHQLWEQAILFTVVSTLLPFSFFLIGLRRVTPTGASIASTMETVSASLFAFLFLGERLSGMQLVGAAFILVALLILITQQRPEVPDTPAEPVSLTV